MGIYAQQYVINIPKSHTKDWSNAEFTELISLVKLWSRLTYSENVRKVGEIMLAIVGVLLWAVFRIVLPIIVLIMIGSYVDQKYYRRSVI